MNAIPTPTGLLPGFSDPVAEAQGVFRAVLEAMSRPGTIIAPPLSLAAPAPLSPLTTALLLTLADMDTPVWLDGAAARPAVVEHLGFHCGCPLVAEPGHAAFAVVIDGAAMPPLSAFAAGTDADPDRGATLIIQVARLVADGGWRLSGPGIKGGSSLGAGPLPPGFAAWMAANHAGFPRGIDIILSGPEALACLPRSTRLEG